MITVHKASAGSGKTYNLALEYIKLLLGKKIPGTDRYTLNRAAAYAHRSILAITFTNKATAEMKTRILKELRRLAALPRQGKKDAAYAAALMKEFGCDRADLRQAAHNALRQLLNDYGAFNISTIDAFFQTILRSFAHEIERQGDYRLELDGDTALAQSMTMLFDRINANPDSDESRPILDWLNILANDRLAEGSDINPFNRNSPMYKDIIGSIQSIFDETFAQNEAAVTDYLKTSERLDEFAGWLKKKTLPDKAPDDAFVTLKEEIGNVTTVLRDMALPMKKDAITRLEKVHDFVFGTKKKYTFAKAYKDKIFNIWTNKKPAGYLTAMRECDIEGIFDKQTLKKFIPTTEHIEAIKNWIDTVDRNLTLGILFENMLRGVNTLRAIFHIYKFIDRYRQENNLILISDSNTLLKTIIDGSDTPFIYERVGMKIDNYLIDEFQDTSRMQWDNLRPLVTAKIDTDDSLIIGDVKQAIYQFRGGDPSLLDHEVEDFYHKLPSAPKVNTRGAQPGENTNYRSAHQIVRFNNTLFYDLANAEGTTATGYKGIEQTPASATAGLPFRITVNDLRDDKFRDTAAALFSPEQLNALDGQEPLKAKQVAIKSVAEAIVGQLKRGYKQSDIAILCRWNRNAAEIAEFINRNYGRATDDHPAIKIVSDDSLLLRNSSAVRLIISILEIIDRSFEAPTSDSQENLADIIARTSLFPNDEERNRVLHKYTLRRRRAAVNDKFEYFQAQGMTFEDALTKAIESAEAIGTNQKVENDLAHDIDAIRAEAPANLVALVQAIIMHKVAKQTCKEELPYIAAFVDFVDEFMQAFTPSVHSFLAFWNQCKDKVAIAPGEKDDAVTITTIHKAKGLEWPCVHIPLLNWPFDENPEQEWYDMSKIEFDGAPEMPPIMRLNSNEFFKMKDSPFRKQYEEFEKANRTNNLNIAYVAFTRAINELNVNVTTAPNGLSNIGASILDVLANAPLPPEAATHPELYLDFAAGRANGSFRLGNPTTPTQDVKESDDDRMEPVQIDAPEFNVSFESLNARLANIGRFVAKASGAQGDFIVEEIDNNRAEQDDIDPQSTRRGLIMHSILAQIITLDDFDSAISRHRAITTDDEIRQFADALSKAFDGASEKVLGWFAPDAKVLTEQTIYSPRTKLFSRADRIVRHHDGSVEVVDYKFTSHPHPSHYKQVRDYAAALQLMGNSDVRASLWYPLSGEVINVETK